MGDINKHGIPLNDGSVDLLLSVQSAHYFDLDKFFLEARRVLRSNGLLTIAAHSLPLPALADGLDDRTMALSVSQVLFFLSQTFV